MAYLLTHLQCFITQSLCCSLTFNMATIPHIVISAIISIYLALCNKAGSKGKQNKRERPWNLTLLFVGKLQFADILIMLSVADKCHYAFFLAKKPSVLLQSRHLANVYATSLAYAHPKMPLLSRAYTGKTAFLVTPLTPILIISRLARNLPTPIPAHHYPHQVAHQPLPKCFTAASSTTASFAKISRPLRKISRPVNVSRSTTILAFSWPLGACDALLAKVIALRSPSALERPQVATEDHRCD